jgi:uncharacterized damage-inducible protein DinB
VELLNYFRRQFAYDAWANQEVLAAVRVSTTGESRSLELLAHILSAERLLLERIRQQPQSLPVWPEWNLEQCETHCQEMSQLWHEFLDGLSAAELAQPVSYKNSKGEAYTSTVEDILTHVLLHSAYHRGQVASHMRANGQVPPYTDFIHAARHGVI